MFIPEKSGIPSSSVLNFINHLEVRNLCIHGFIIMKNGKIAAEGYYKPWKSENLHRMYSTSKTFVAVAVGLLIDDGKISLNDKIVDFFPEYCPDEVHPYIEAMTIRDLLMMATPYTYGTYGNEDKNWTWTFLNRKPSHPPGTIFNYDTSGTVMLNAIAEKVSGQELIEFLRPRILDKLGFSEDTFCVKRPEGGAWGGSGVLCRTRDLANFAQLLLNKGKWNGEQLISEEFVTEATSAQIDNRATTSEPELQFGYGYQIWRTRNNGFATIGMGTQISVCLPDKDLLFVVNADTQFISSGTEIILNSFWTYVYPYVQLNEIEIDSVDNENLNNKLNNLKFIPVEGNLKSEKSDLFSGKYNLFDNPMNIKDIKFNFGEERGTMCYTNATGYHEISFGFGNYYEGIFPETHYYGNKIGVPKNEGYKYAASAAWFNDENLIIYLYIIDDYFGTLKINVSFKNNEISLYMSKVAEWFLNEYSGFAGGEKE